MGDAKSSVGASVCVQEDGDHDSLQTKNGTLEQQRFQQSNVKDNKQSNDALEECRKKKKKKRGKKRGKRKSTEVQEEPEEDQHDRISPNEQGEEARQDQRLLSRVPDESAQGTKHECHAVQKEDLQKMSDRVDKGLEEVSIYLQGQIVKIRQELEQDNQNDKKRIETLENDIALLKEEDKKGRQNDQNDIARLKEKDKQKRQKLKTMREKYRTTKQEMVHLRQEMKIMQQKIDAHQQRLEEMQHDPLAENGFQEHRIASRNTSLGRNDVVMADQDDLEEPDDALEIPPLPPPDNHFIREEEVKAANDSMGHPQDSNDKKEKATKLLRILSETLGQHLPPSPGSDHPISGLRGRAQLVDIDEEDQLGLLLRVMVTNHFHLAEVIPPQPARNGGTNDAGPTAQLNSDRAETDWGGIDPEVVIHPDRTSMPDNSPQQGFKVYEDKDQDDDNRGERYEFDDLNGDDGEDPHMSMGRSMSPKPLPKVSEPEDTALSIPNGVMHSVPIPNRVEHSDSTPQDKNTQSPMGSSSQTSQTTGQTTLTQASKDNQAFNNGMLIEDSDSNSEDVSGEFDSKMNEINPASARIDRDTRIRGTARAFTAPRVRPSCSEVASRPNRKGKQRQPTPPAGPLVVEDTNTNEEDAVNGTQSYSPKEKAKDSSQGQIQHTEKDPHGTTTGHKTFPGSVEQIDLTAYTDGDSSSPPSSREGDSIDVRQSPEQRRARQTTRKMNTRKRKATSPPQIEESSTRVTRSRTRSENKNVARKTVVTPKRKRKR